MEGASTRSSLPFFSVADYDKAQAQYQRISRQTEAEKAASLEAYLRGVKEPFHLDHQNYRPCARLLCSHRLLLLALALLALCLPSLALASLVGSRLIGLTLPIHLLWRPLFASFACSCLSCSLCMLALCIPSLALASFVGSRLIGLTLLIHLLSLRLFASFACFLSLMLDLPFGRRYSMCSVRGDLFSVSEGDSDRGIHSSLTA